MDEPPGRIDTAPSNAVDWAEHRCSRSRLCRAGRRATVTWTSCAVWPMGGSTDLLSIRADELAVEREDLGRVATPRATSGTA